MKKQSLQITKNYETWINELKNRYRATQVQAALAVNSALIEFYYNLGKDICRKYNDLTKTGLYGRKFFDQLSEDLKRAIPESTGLSPKNIRNCKYSADSLIANRVEVARELNEILKEKMAEKEVIVSDIAITNFEFSKQFLKAVEEKQIAEQEAKRATNLVEKVKKEAEQKILQAEAEAKSLRLQREVVSDNLIKLRQVEAQLKAIDKWDGRMPNYMAGNQMPFVMVK